MELHIELSVDHSPSEDGRQCNDCIKRDHKKEGTKLFKKIYVLLQIRNNSLQFRKLQKLGYILSSGLCCCF